MTRTIIRIALVAALLAAPVQAMTAQEYIGTPVTVSKEKVRVNGKICYSHIVLEKQTLFSIAKAYNVSLDDINRMNPSLQETGLKKNSIILIPVPEEKPAEKPVEKQAEKQTEKPIEKQAEKAESKQEKKDKKQKTHVRKWYEDLDVIADKYGVTVEAIMKANNLTGRKLANRQKLIIPEPGEIIETPLEEIMTTEPSDTTSVTTSATTEEPADSLSSVQPETPLVFSPKEDVEMTLILPLKAGETNSSRNNLDFYSGVLLAVRDMAEKGIGTELNVYDSTDPGHPVSNEDLEGSDVIIGPVSSGDLRRLFETVPESGMVVSPLDPRAEALAYSHENFIQAPAPHKAQYLDLLQWIKEDMSAGDKVLMIGEKGAKNSDAIMQMQEIADSSGLEIIPFSYSILEGRDVIKPLTALMTAEGANRILINSDSEAFVNDVVRNLNILVYNKLNVVLYAPSKIRGYETIEVENLHNTSTHVSMAYYIDYDDQRVKDFLLKYRAIFGTEPTQFSFQGYDIASYFIDLCSRYGNRWDEMLEASEKGMLQSTFRYTRAADGGYVNNGIRRIVYGKDWAVTKTR